MYICLICFPKTESKVEELKRAKNRLKEKREGEGERERDRERERERTLSLMYLIYNSQYKIMYNI